MATFTGTTGNDSTLLVGTTGADTLVGLAGDDTYTVDNAGDIVTEAASEGTDTVNASVTHTLAANVENLVLTGATAINGTGNTLNNILTGNSATNTLTGGTGNDTYVVSTGDIVVESSTIVSEIDTVQSTVTFTLGSNLENLTLLGASVINATGNALANTLIGNSAANTLNGGTGADNMTGGTGNDIYVVDNVGDVVTETSTLTTEIDLVQSSISYTLSANVESLTLTGASAINATGNSLANTITGNTAANILDGGTGADTLIGGTGNDTYIIGDAAEVVTETSTLTTEVDLVQSSVSFTLSANVENLTLTGASAINATGNTLANTLTGNTAANVLSGGTGIDTMIGGTGNDTYVVDNFNDVVTETSTLVSEIDLVQSSTDYTLSANVENLTLTGSLAVGATGNTLANVLAGDSNSAANVLTGGTGNDTYIVGAGDTVSETSTLVSEIDLVQSAISFTLSTNVENLTLTGASAVNATGNTQANVLTGNAAANLLDGGTGADTLVGDTGSDTYVIDNVGDVITETSTLGTEIDLVQSSITYSLAANNNLENLTLTGASAINATGNTLANTLTGNTAANVLDGATGADTLIGGTGNDTYVVDNVGDVVTESSTVVSEIDTIQSSISLSLNAIANVENLTLTGASVIDATGNSFANTLTGNTAANVLDGGTGADTLVGGTGDDTYIVDNAADVVTETSTIVSEIDTVQSSVTFTLSANVENLTLTGASAINATGNSLANTLTGNTAANILDGGTGADTLIGGTGNDTYVVDNVGDIVNESSTLITEIDLVQSSISYTLGDNLENLTLTGAGVINATGNSLNNALTGNTVANILDGGEGADTLVGGTGNDTYIVDNVGDVVTETSTLVTDIDTVQSSVTITLSTNIENLVLTGSADINGTGNNSANTVTGNSGNNLLDGGSGADTHIGGLGNDTYVVGNAADVITELADEGVDTVLTAVSHTLSNNVENLTLTGAAVANAIGNTLDNVLIGNTAANILNGGAGADNMSGGTGNDTYVVDNALDVVIETSTLSTEIDLVQSSISHTLSDNVENLTLTGAVAIDGIGNSLANALTGNTAANLLDGGTGADALVGGAGNDTYVVDNAGDVVTESSTLNTEIDTVQASISYTLGTNLDNLTLTGAAAINATGNTRANVLTGNEAANVLTGGTGNDTYIVGAGDTIVETSTVVTEIDTVQADSSYTLATNLENLILVGTALNATGNSVANTLTGNAEANVLDGGLGNDTMIGGDGSDTYIVDAISDVITETSTIITDVDTVQASISYTLSANVEALTLTGSSAINGTGNASDNILNGDANSAANVLTGGAGNDLYIIGTGDTIVETSTVVTEVDTVQTSDSFTLSANLENLILTGTNAINGTGNTAANKLVGNSATNTLTGGLGDDTYVIDSATDVIVELANEGNDTVETGIAYTLGTTLENLTLTGTAAVKGTGNNENNILSGVLNTAANALTGGTGNDTYIVGTGDTAVETSTLATEIDTVQASMNFTLGTNLENLVLTGTSALNGTGNTLANTITGNSGANILSGAAGADTLIGGEGNDTYVIDNVADVVVEASTIVTEIDTVQSSVSYALGATNVENITLTGTTAINATGNDLANVLTGNTGANILTGGLGNDTYIIGAGDTIVETSTLATEIDTVQSSIAWTLANNLENLTLTGTTALNGTGNTVANILTGNTAANLLNGGAGADTLIGGTGNDTYVVDNSLDVVTEVSTSTTEIDLVQASVSYTLSDNVENLTLTGTSAINGTGNASNNIINSEGNTGVNSLDGGTGNDTYIIGVGDTVTESSTLASEIDLVQSSASFTLGANIEKLTLTGSSGISGIGNNLANTLTGNGAGNLLDGGTGNDTMVGGTGNDTYVVDVVGDVVTESSTIVTERDTVQAAISYTLGANLENLTLTGAATLNGTGNALANIITGNSAANLLTGAAGADTLIGGAGNDTYIVDNALDVITESSILAEEIDSVEASVSYTLGATNVENLTLTGTTAINGTGNARKNLLTGNSAANVLTGGAGNDTYVIGAGDTVVETSTLSTEIDTVQSSISYTLGDNVESLLLLASATAVNATGNALANALTGNALANLMDGGAGIDTLVGGTGNDTYLVDNSADVVTETSTLATEIDLVQSSASYTLGANIESLTLIGSAAINGTANDSANIIRGDDNSAANTLTGKLGNDTYFVGAGDIAVETSTLTTEIDIVNAGVSYTLGANIEQLTLTGTSAINGVGNTSANLLTGNTAANLLDGGAGNDTLVGGTGNDTYVVDAVGDVVTESTTLTTEIDTVEASITYSLGANLENLTLTGAAAINATGNALANIITGNSGANIITGGTGADTLIGGTGNDTYVIDNIADVVTETSTLSTEIDTVQSSVTYSLGANVENLTLTGTTAINATGNSLNNVLTGNTGVNVLTGGAGNDTYIVTAGDTISETSTLVTEIDSVQASVSYTLGTNVENLSLTGTTAINGTGNASANLLTGNAAANTLNGGTGADTLIGGAGADTYIVDNAGDVVTEASTLATEIDTVQASVSFTLGDNLEKLTLTGTTAINGAGNALANTLTGNTAANLLDGGAGKDTMIGGTGADTYIVDSALDVVTESSTLSTERDTVQASISYTLGTNVEILVLTGAAAINGTGNTAANSITGNSADNLLSGGTGADTLIGGTGNDTYVVDNIADVITETSTLATEIDTIQSSVVFSLSANVENLVLTGTTAINATGNSQANTLTGNTAANILDGGAGADTMIGGTGNDTYVVDNVGDVVTETSTTAAELDTVQSSITYTLGANVENLTLTGITAINGTGNTLKNIITGNSAANLIDGGTGVDTLIGGTGNDTYVVDVAGDVVTETSTITTEIDTIISAVNYTLGANIEALTLTGTATNATGNTLANTLTGTANADLLDGGTGIDTLIGGLGNDTYVVDNSADVVTETSTLLTEVDLVQSTVAYTLSANIESLTLTGTSAVNGTGNGSANILRGDGNSAANVLTGQLGNDSYFVGAGDTAVETSTLTTEIDIVNAFVSYTLGANIEHLTLAGTSAINGTGNTLANILTGNTAANTLDGGTGADTMIGGTGNDVYVVDNSGDLVTETSTLTTEIDTVQSSITYTLVSNVERLVLTGAATINGTGNTLANTITGNTAANILNGSSGADTLIGGLGNDTYVVDSLGDVITEAVGGGADTINSSISFTASTDIESLTLIGTAAINATGNNIANTLTGNTAANILDGGLGSDSLLGGLGNDTYLFGLSYGNDRVTESDTTAGNTDVLLLGVGVSYDQLWFRHVGNDLEVSIIGTSDNVLITNWYNSGLNTVNTAASIEKIMVTGGVAADDELLTSNVEALVNAMAAVSSTVPVTTTLTTEQRAALASQLAASWT